MAETEVRKAVKPKECPSCGGSHFAVLRYNGNSYWQCVSPRPTDENPKAICKYWSTKWEAQ